MEYKEKAKEIARRYNQGQGTISALCKDIGIGRSTFYKAIGEIGIVKDDEKDIYIIPDIQVKDQEEPAPAEPKEERKGQRMKQEKKKKTFEIDVELEQLIRIQAAIEDITINEWVNNVLWKAIPDDTRKIIKR